jgi:hypothetical protein
VRIGTIVGSRGGKFLSLGAGNASEILKKFRKEKFEGFEKVCFFDTGGRLIRKSGAPVKAPAPAKAPVKK